MRKEKGPRSLSPHHMVPTAKGTMPNGEDLFEGWSCKQHHCFHEVFQNEGPERIVQLLAQWAFNCTITNRLVIALCLIHHPLSKKDTEVALRMVETTSCLVIPEQRKESRSAWRESRLEEVFGTTNPQERILWVVRNLMPDPSVWRFKKSLTDPLVIALYEREKEGATTKKALAQISQGIRGTIRGSSTIVLTRHKEERPPQRIRTQLHHTHIGFLHKATIGT